MATLLERAWRTLLTGTAFLLFFTGGALLSFLVLPAARLRGGTAADRARRCRRLVARAWLLFHDYMRIAGLLRYDPRDARFRLPPGPFVLVANHPTLIDVTALVAAVPDLVVVAKSAMFRSPLVGRLLRYCNHIESGEGLFAGAMVVEQAVERLAAGTPVLVFPEGTRSPRHGVGTIRAGAFEAAARAGVPVVVALLRCEPPTLLRGEPWYAIPARSPVLSVEQLPTLTVAAGEATHAARALQRQLEALVRAAPPAPAAGAMSMTPTDA